MYRAISLMNSTLLMSDFATSSMLGLRNGCLCWGSSGRDSSIAAESKSRAKRFWLCAGDGACVERAVCSLAHGHDGDSKAFRERAIAALLARIGQANGLPLSLG